MWLHRECVREAPRSSRDLLRGCGLIEDISQAEILIIEKLAAVRTFILLAVVMDDKRAAALGAVVALS